MTLEYQYKALNKEGNVLTGIKKAENELELQKELKTEGLNLLSAESVSKISFKSLWIKISNIGTISEHEKIIFNRNLSSMLEAGLPLSRAIDVLKKQSKNPKLKKILDFVNLEVNKGRSLSESMSHFPEFFSPLMISMVQSGEESGNLTEALNVIAEQMEKSYTLKKKIKGAMVYPSVIIVAMVIIGIFMLVYIVPTLTGTFAELDVELPKSTQLILSFSEFLQNNLILAISIFLGTGVTFYLALKTKMGKRGCDWFILHTPLVAPLVKEINSARTTRTLSSLLTSGVPFVRSLQIVSEVIQNSYYKDILNQAEKNIQLGLPISKVFREAEKYYPIFVSEMMIVGEETGEMGAMLLKVANFYEEEVDQKTKNLSTVVEPFLMVLVGIMVGFFALSMITPMYSVMENI
jgi:type IV pilus assembly protein PilC